MPTKEATIKEDEAKLQTEHTEKENFTDVMSI